MLGKRNTLSLIFVLFFCAQSFGQALLDAVRLNDGKATVGIENSRFFHFNIKPLSKVHLSFYQSLYNDNIKNQSFRLRVGLNVKITETLQYVPSLNVRSDYGFTNQLAWLKNDLVIPLKGFELANVFYVSYNGDDVNILNQFGAHLKPNEHLTFLAYYGSSIFFFENRKTLEAGILIEEDKLKVRATLQVPEVDFNLTRVLLTFSYRIGGKLYENVEINSSN